MKKFFAIFFIVLAAAAVLLLTAFIWGDDIYSYFAFSDSEVIQVDEDTYRCPKNEFDPFIEYLAADGWEMVDQMGAMCFFEKDGDKTAYRCHFTDFYTEWSRCEAD